MDVPWVSSEMNGNGRPLVSFVVVARNAGRHLPDLFADLRRQDYPRDSIQVVLVDGLSEDDSVERMRAFKDADPGFRVDILRNPRRILACGWNVALSAADGDVILRVDAHARIPADFVRRNVEALEKGESVVGGVRESVIPDEFPASFYAVAEASKFGAGAAGFKHPGQARYVDTLAHAAYRRSVFQRVGGYDERLVRTEDNEIHCRMKAAGFRFFYDPRIKSYHYPRASLRGLLAQKYANGHGVGLTLGVAPRCFGIRHFVPLAFVSALLAGFAGGWLGCWVPLLLLLGAYAAAALPYSFSAMGEVRGPLKPACLGLPPVFFLIHVAYGVGTLRGLLEIPSFRARYRGYAVPRPIQS